MQTRKLGSQGLEVPVIGLGCMGMSWAYGATNDSESIRVLQRSIELGMNFWDTALSATTRYCHSERSEESRWRKARRRSFAALRMTFGG
jgi:aryl-alcohol dehydrogenase-like predicted oxidoreductase